MLALLHCPEDPGNMLRSTGKEKKKKKQEQKYHLKIQTNKEQAKILTSICQIPIRACKIISGTDCLSEKVLLSKCLEQVCGASKSVFSLFEGILRGQWHQGW